MSVGRGKMATGGIGQQAPEETHFFASLNSMTCAGSKGLSQSRLFWRGTPNEEGQVSVIFVLKQGGQFMGGCRWGGTAGGLFLNCSFPLGFFDHQRRNVVFDSFHVRGHNRPTLDVLVIQRPKFNCHKRLIGLILSIKIIT